MDATANLMRNAAAEASTLRVAGTTVMIAARHPSVWRFAMDLGHLTKHLWETWLASSAAPFTMYASPDRSKGIYSALNSRGMIEFVIEAGPQAGPRGHVLFEEMIKHFGSNAQGVMGCWTYGSNLARFNERTSRGVPLEDAAAATWTGTQAIRHGFRTVRVLTVQSTTGAYAKVLAEFTP